ncbi:hypothetical protein FOL47_009592 [Perkinsus chesapeaki]|uniref:Uncharacterized protein n=1 Tax=Perkinsus chesapeaki TaxID=330153 RepID=A0A7J6MS25_PERCH|nr:hypothetical protein FOL47_009592 [Perkinsus chesapeaki]
MRLPPHVMALELRLFHKMLEKAAGNGPPPDMLHEFAPHLGKRELTLDCPREEILVSPSPSFVFVMNEELLGVYPTGNGLHIKKPFKGVEQVMVLKPGFKGEAVYYYDSKNNHLFILHDDMRKLHQYDLSAEPEAISSIDVHGLHKDCDGLTGRKPQMICTDEFFFILDTSDRLFCVDRADVGSYAQARSIWCAEGDGLSECCLSLHGSDALGVTLLGFASDYRWTRIRFELKYRKDPLYFRAVSDEMAPATDVDVAHRVLHIFPLSSDLIVATMLSLGGTRVGLNLHFIDSSLKVLGPASGAFDGYYNKTKQVVCGGNDIIYSLAVGDTAAQLTRARDYPGFAGNNGCPNKRQRQASSCKITTYYVYKD